LERIDETLHTDLHAGFLIVGCSSNNDNNSNNDPNAITDEVEDTGILRNWALESYSFDDGVRREPGDLSPAGINFFQLNRFRANYNCGGIEGNFSLDSDVLSTSNARIIDDDVSCDGEGEVNAVLNEFIQSSFNNTALIISLTEESLVVTTVMNESSEFVLASEN